MKAQIATRKKGMQQRVEIEGVGFCFKYYCRFTASARIDEELKPKEAISNKKSHLDLGDKLAADKIEIYCLKLGLIPYHCYVQIYEFLDKMLAKTK